MDRLGFSNERKGASAEDFWDEIVRELGWDTVPSQSSKCITDRVEYKKLRKSSAFSKPNSTTILGAFNWNSSDTKNILISGKYLYL